MIYIVSKQEILGSNLYNIFSSINIDNFLLRKFSSLQMKKSLSPSNLFTLQSGISLLDSPRPKRALGGGGLDVLPKLFCNRSNFLVILDWRIGGASLVSKQGKCFMMIVPVWVISQLFCYIRLEFYLSAQE